jgi:putative DNA primase/helicase
LLKEGAGILAWAVQGALDWQEHSMPPTPEVDDVAKNWRRDADQIGRFIESCCTTIPTAQVYAQPLYTAYRKWAEESGERAETLKKFSDRLQERNFTKERKEKGVLYFGIGLLAD